jgi:hypothetical protein
LGFTSTISSVRRLVGRKGYMDDGEPHTYSKIGAEKRNFGIGKPKKSSLVCWLRWFFSIVVKYGEVACQLADGDN